jgi:small subunit ribosomal protein S4
MGRYTGPVCRLCRAQGTKLFLKGERCFTPRCAIERRKSPPGPHAASGRRRRPSDYGLHLREKQKVRRVYGVLERQFSKMFGVASKTPGVTGALLMQLLERRLDNVAYRLGYGESRVKARQIVTHGHLQVNGRDVSVPSFIVKTGDKITWKEQSKKTELFKNLQAGSFGKRSAPRWLRSAQDGASAEVTALPEASDIDTTVDTRLITEYYSKR